MTSPCGKCNTCSCSKNQQRQATEQDDACPAQTVQSSAPSACGVCSAPIAQSSAPAPKSTAGCACPGSPTKSNPLPPCAPEPNCTRTPTKTIQRNTAKPKIECLCANNRTRGQSASVQAPLADTYTCTRPRPEEKQPVPWEERCTCKAKPAPPNCECAPAQPVAQAQCQPIREPTHAYISCGQPTPEQPPRQQISRAPPRCGHCASQRKKKCVIQ